MAERLGATAPRQLWLIGNPTLLAALSQNRLLLLSPFEKTSRRVTADSARRRNELVPALADRAFIAYCTPGGLIATLAARMNAWNIPCMMKDNPITS